MRIRTHVFVVALAVAAPRPAGAQHYHLDDSLRGGTLGNASGGSFGAEGWTVTGVGDRIWYALPTLASGYAEFSVSHITLANLPLGDHEIFAMYEDGYGMGEPINYNPQFRQNHYKALVRIYGTAEPARAGMMKLMWGMCPSGAPGWSETACGCASFFGEPFADPGPWTDEAPMRIRVEWGGGFSRLFRNGVEVVGIDWSASGLSFGPSDLHLMIGSPRNDGGLSAMPMGAVFSDLVIDGEPGPLATCPATTIADPGTCDGLATSDATAASWESGVYPDVNDLNVEGDGAAPSGVAYLRFAPIAGPVARATLRVHVATTASAGGGSGRACRVDAGAWDPSTLTWSTRPTVSSDCVGVVRAVAAGEEISWDVTPLLAAGGEPTLAIVSTDPDGAHYVSSEAGGCAFGPRLEVELAPSVDAGTPIGPGSDASVPPVDTGRGRGSIAACSCRAAGADRPSLALPALVAIAFAARKRKRLRR